MVTVDLADIYVTDHALQRFRERSLCNATEKTVKEAVHEARPIRKSDPWPWHRPRVRGCAYRLHRILGVVFVLEHESDFVRVITCWKADQYR